MTLFLNELVGVGATVDMMVNHTTHLAPQITLVRVKNVVVDQRDLLNGGRVRVLLSKLVIEVQVVMRDLAVGQVFDDLQVAEKVGAVAVDHWHPLLVQFALVVVC